jgi:hypothetical protein
MFKTSWAVSFFFAVVVSIWHPSLTASQEEAEKKPINGGADEKPEDGDNLANCLSRYPKGSESNAFILELCKGGRLLDGPDNSLAHQPPFQTPGFQRFLNDDFRLFEEGHV